MCGIAGIVAPPNDQLRAALRRMLIALDHRGPDGRGTVEFSNCLLGHTRLSIVDIDGGAQPMVHKRADGDLAVTFNGEIYGYRSLRNAYRKYDFVTKSDTELLLAAYRSNSKDMMQKIPGMFSFAIWDDQKKELFCARDRFGEKPFYYAIGESGEFVFASEISAIIASGLVRPSLDSASLVHYLQRLYVPINKSIYIQIHALPPAHSLTFSNSRIQENRYWRLPAVESSMSLDSAAVRLRQLLTNAVEKQLVADVPVGSFLSGGVDSTTITMLASQIEPGIHSFSFDFPGALSEKEFATAAAAKYRTAHTIMSEESFDISEVLPKVIKAYGEPFADTSAIPTYFLCKQAAKHAKVVLTGDGGDELFGGYQWYQPLFWMQNYADTSWLKKLVLRIYSRSLRELGLPGAGRAEEKNVGAIYSHRYKSVLEAHRKQLQFFNDDAISRLGLPVPQVAEWEVRGSLDDALRADISDYMPGDILTKIDRASMAHSLELRAPFLDVDVAEFCLSLPAALKISKDADKLPLRHAFSDQWPASIRGRRKQGFGGPTSQWLSNSTIEDMLASLVWDKNSKLTDYLDTAELAATKPALSDLQTWSLLCLGIWLDKHSTIS